MKRHRSWKLLIVTLIIFLSLVYTIAYAQSEPITPKMYLPWLSGGHSNSEPYIPSGGVIFWPLDAGVIPTGWSIYADASGRVLVGTDNEMFANGSTGGVRTIDIAHVHGSGTLATDNDTHDHLLKLGRGLSGGGFTQNILFAATVNNDTHSHNVNSGTTAPQLSSSQSNLQPYLVGIYIQKD